jgi:hypothetical protein
LQGTEFSFDQRVALLRFMRARNRAAEHPWHPPLEAASTTDRAAARAQKKVVQQAGERTFEEALRLLCESVFAELPPP